MQESLSWADLEGFKVRFNERNHYPKCLPEADHMLGGLLIRPERAFDDKPHGLLVNDRGKKRFETHYSSFDEKPAGKKTIPHPDRDNHKDSGKKLIPVMLHCQTEVSLQTRKKNKESSMRRSESGMLPSLDWTKKRVITNENGIPAALKESDLVSLEETMNRKQRITSIMQKRNLLPIATQGDNPYKAAEQHPDYYKEGGLIPGSTNILHKSGKPSFRKSESDTLSSNTKLVATFGKMNSRLDREYDVSQVLSLTVSILLKLFATYLILCVSDRRSETRGTSAVLGRKYWLLAG